MNRHILVRNRKVECVGPRELVQNGIASETVTLGLDHWYDGLEVTLVLGSGENARAEEWTGKPMAVPQNLLETVGPLAVSVVGRLGGDVRITSKAAPDCLEVVESGAIDARSER